LLALDVLKQDLYPPSRIGWRRFTNYPSLASRLIPQVTMLPAVTMFNEHAFGSGYSAILRTFKRMEQHIDVIKVSLED
jgi:hypothetical protein